MNSFRKYQTQLEPFDLSNPVDLARWVALLTPGADLSAYEAGDRVFDSLTRTCLVLLVNELGELEWGNENGTVARYIVNEDVQPFHWATPDTFPAWRTTYMDGMGAGGIFMGPAKNGERAYVMNAGTYLLLKGTESFSIPAALATDALGRARNFAGPFEYYMAFNTQNPTIGGVDYLVAQVNTPVVVF